MMNLFCITCILLWATYPQLTQAVPCRELGYCDAFRVHTPTHSNLENVALGKTAKLNGADAAGLCNFSVSVAVNGVTDEDNCCIESNHDDYTPSLTVDLGQTYNISFITIYRRHSWENRMVGMAIFVDDELCDVIDEEEAKGDSSFLPDVTNPPVPITIYCQSSPVLGSVVTLVKNTTRRYSWTFSYIINICEIEVWAENPGFPSKSDAGKVLTTSTITPEKTKNVALGKTAKINGADAAGSGRHNRPVSVAVNGVKDDDDCCVESNRFDYTPSLTVDLGQTYNISFITIYRRYSWKNRMVGMAIFVDDELCDVIDEEEAKGDSSFLPDVTNPPVPITIYCQSSPVLGSVVTLVKNTTRRYYWTFPYIINICEIEVWAENPGFTSKSDAGKVLTTSTITPEKNNPRSTHEDTHVLTVSLGVGTIIAGFCLLCLVVILLVWVVRRGRKESCSDGKSGGVVNPVFSITKKDLC